MNTLLIGAALAGALTIPTVAALPANAATPPHAARAYNSPLITSKEYRRIKPGMSLSKARRIIGGKGTKTASYTWTDGGYCARTDWDADDNEYCADYVLLTEHTVNTYRWMIAAGGAAYLNIEGGYVTSKYYWR